MQTDEIFNGVRQEKSDHILHRPALCYTRQLVVQCWKAWTRGRTWFQGFVRKERTIKRASGKKEAAHLHRRAEARVKRKTAGPSGWPREAVLVGATSGARHRSRDHFGRRLAGEWWPFCFYRREELPISTVKPAWKRRAKLEGEESRGGGKGATPYWCPRWGSSACPELK